MTRLRKYGVEATIDFEVYGIDGVDLNGAWVPAAVDCEIMKDGGSSTQCTNTATDEGATFSIVLTATEMQAARLVLKVVDAATKVILDTVVHIETYGHASAQHAMDLDDGVRAGLTALPNAAANAAGGLPISAAGALLMDTLADWIDGGRLDLLLDAIPDAAGVNAEVVDALATDTYAEPAQGAPGATVSLAAKLNYLYKVLRNKKIQTATEYQIFNDAGAVVDHKATISDVAGTFTKGEIETGP